MIFRETGLTGAWLIEPERVSDERGYFARTWCVEEFNEFGINVDFVQCSTSFNESAGTRRGIHYQVDPHSEAKLIRCTRGRLYDVMVDLRPESNTYTEWRAFELSADNGRMVYLPQGFGHGFQTIENGTELAYHISEYYQPDLSHGIRWDDPTIGIDWPDCDNPIMSTRDKNLPALNTHTRRAAAQLLRAAG